MNELKKSLKVNHLTIKNRLVFPPMATSKSENSEVNQALLDYYYEKSLGGYLGFMIVEHMYINAVEQASDHQLSIARDTDIIGLKKLVDVIHENKTLVFAQINHAGSKSIHEHKISASAIKHPFVKDSILPEEMSLQDIQEVIRDFSAAAKRAKAAGFDGVEIHSAHGYLLNQFYSPLTNCRHDSYGGSLSARLQIHLDIIQSIRTVVGDDYPIALRLGACDYVEGGNDHNDALKAALLLEKVGIDLLDVSGGLRGYVRPGYHAAGYYSDMTQIIKKNVSIPVLLTGGVRLEQEAQELLKGGYADLIGVGRAIFADSHWAKNCMK